MKMKKLALVLAVCVMGSFVLAGCGSSDETADTTSTTEATEEVSATEETDDAATAPGESAGFTEYPIFEDIECGFLNVSAVYFQPVPMSNGNEDTESFDLHLEADVSALENDLGFGVGDWVPYMTVDYQVINEETEEVAAEGTFMEMSASDGPHYGANISLPEAGTYTVVFTFGSPEDNGYLLHTDDETGPGGSFDTYWGSDSEYDMTVTYTGWEYTPQEW